MEKQIHRWQNFVIGLLVGVLAGGAIVWLEMRDENRNFLSQILYELNTLKLEKKITEEEIEKAKEIQTRQEKPTSGKIQKQKNRNEKKLTTEDTLRAITIDSLYHVVLNSDSALNDSASGNEVLNVAEVENIIVKKDRLLFSKSIKLTVKDEIIQENKDSLVSELSGMNKDENKNDYSVEFWESPINYKGYKMANKKILLFGIDNFESASLFQADKKIYLKINDSFYQLDETYNFAPFKKITDKMLLTKIE